MLWDIRKSWYIYEGKKYNAKEGEVELFNPYYITGVSGAEQFEEARVYTKNVSGGSWDYTVAWY